MTMLTNGAFGLVPNSPFAQQYLDLVSSVIPPQLIIRINEFLRQIGAPTIPENQYFDQEEKTPLDPGGWILEQLFDADLPPIGSITSESESDPAGAIFEVFGVETDTLPAPEIPLDPIGEFALLFGVELEGGTDADISPLLDPGGSLLSLFIKENYLYSSEGSYNPLMDPGGQILGLFFPQEMLGQPEAYPFLVHNTLRDPIGLILGETPLPVESVADTTPGIDVIGFFFQSSPSLLVNGNSSAANNARGYLSFIFNRIQVSPTSSTEPSSGTNLAATDAVGRSVVTEVPSDVARLPAANYVFAPTSQLPDVVEEIQAPPTIPPTDPPTAPPTVPPTVPPTSPPVTSAVVNSTNDPGLDGICDTTECTLREAVVLLSSGGTITFDPAIYGSTITLSSIININNNLSISGSGSNMTIDGNSSTPIFAVNTGNVSIYGLSLSNGLNAGGDGGAIVFNGGTLTIFNCTLSGNTGNNGGAIYHNSAGYLSISNTIFFGNYANFNGGAIYENGTGDLYLQNSRFSANTSTWDGGGIYSLGGPLVDIQNSIFVYNSTSANGGGIYFGGSTPQFRNSTLWGNTASAAGGGIYNAADLDMRNNILWNNTGSFGPQIYDAGGAVMGNNNIQGNGNSGTNIDSDPMFVSNFDPLDLHLSPGSPSRDTGDNSWCTLTDITGASRPINICDMGAYEQ